MTNLPLWWVLSRILITNKPWALKQNLCVWLVMISLCWDGDKSWHQKNTVNNCPGKKDEMSRLFFFLITFPPLNCCEKQVRERGHQDSKHRMDISNTHKKKNLHTSFHIHKDFFPCRLPQKIVSFLPNTNQSNKQCL